MAEIQEAIEKLPSQEKRALTIWLSAREYAESSSWEKKLMEMAADPQVSAELRRINDEFTGAETDGLHKV
jgi:hypothetical protein